MDATELDRLMRSWAKVQHGLVARDQLARQGVDPRAVRRRLQSHDWELLTTRVLRLVGAPAPDHQRVMAAVLDAGRGTVASHRTAAAVWGLGGFNLRRLEVSRARDGSGRPTHLSRIHHPRSLPAEHITRRHRIPVTTLARTVVDLAGTEHPRRVEVAAHAAVRLGLTWRGLAAVTEDVGGRGHRGIGLIRRLVGEHEGQRPLESGLEARVLALLSRRGCRRPAARSTSVATSGPVASISSTTTSASSSR